MKMKKRVHVGRTKELERNSALFFLYATDKEHPVSRTTGDIYSDDIWRVDVSIPQILFGKKSFRVFLADDVRPGFEKRTALEHIISVLRVMEYAFQDSCGRTPPFFLIIVHLGRIQKLELGTLATVAFVGRHDGQPVVCSPVYPSVRIVL